MRTPTKTNYAIGQNIRRYRLIRDKTLKELGHALGLTYQQVQKFEAGTDRVSASQLLEISKVLNIPIEAFFANAAA